MRRCLVLLVLLCLLPAGMAHGDSDGHEPFEERLLEGALGPMDLHGTRLAWAAMRDGAVQLIVTDLADGSELTATGFEAAGREPVQSLAFDGRWIAWTDPRFGNLDAFAIDTETGRLLRLSDHSTDDRDIDVEDGRFAWVRGGVMVSDGTGPAQAVPSSGASFEPAFAGGWLVWSQIEEQRRVIRGQYLADGSVHTLADNEGILHKNLHGASDGRIIWIGVSDEVSRVYTRTLHADGGAGETLVLTDWGAYGAPRTGGGRGAWKHQDTVHVEHVGGHSGTVPVGHEVLLSDGLLVLTAADDEGIHATPMRWKDWDARSHVEVRDPRPYLVAAGVAVLVGGAGLQWFRARRQGD